MKEKRLLALGIPTCKRPESAVRAINNAIEIGIYDQIIVSSNSYEEQISDFIKQVDRKEITYFQQKDNVGMSLNYLQVIKLCKCKYLHMVRDKDLLNKQNTIDLYSLLDQCDDVPLVVLSIMSSEGSLYRDASWQKNTNLKNVFGDTGHMGGSIINVEAWNNETFNKMSTYCKRKGDTYPTSAAAILSYSVMKNDILYFAPHIVEMGLKNIYSEMSGYSIYGFESRLNQFISLFLLMGSVVFKKKLIVYMHLFNIFFHHHFISAINKYPDDRPIAISKDVLKGKLITFNIKLAVYSALAIFYIIRVFYALRKPIGSFLRVIKLRP
jgi:hypothetical protein